MVTRKVFCLGLTKTGKTSLDAALKRLGYSVFHYPPYARVMEYAARFDALSDITVIPWLERLDRAYPNALFVLTVRDVEDWLAVMPLHYHKHGRPTRGQRAMRKLIYGSDVFDAELYRHAWNAHTARVCAYFRGRPGKLLVMDICAGDGYAKLCPALGLPVVDAPFPHGHRLEVRK